METIDNPLPVQEHELLDHPRAQGHRQDNSPEINFSF
jgi:hypothetical protein